MKVRYIDEAVIREADRVRYNLLATLEEPPPWGLYKTTPTGFANAVRYRVEAAKSTVASLRLELARLEVEWAAGNVPWSLIENCELRIRMAQVRLREAIKLAKEHLKDLGE